MFRVLVAGIILLLAGCTAQKTAEEYGSNAADVIFACAGENWVSQQFNEKFCLMRSVKNPNEYVLAEDTAEKYGDSVLAGLKEHMTFILKWTMLMQIEKREEMMLLTLILLSL